MDSRQSNLRIVDNIDHELLTILEEFSEFGVYVLMDEQTKKYCYPLISSVLERCEFGCIVLPNGEEHKNLESVSKVWTFLSNNGARRHSLLINLGGGMICDLGGFVASTFKRGIAFVNIPTTLLSQVDASVGGKTGFNFLGLKNEIGVINDAYRVILCGKFLNTLPQCELMSGFAEMLKHSLINGQEHLNKLMVFSHDNMYVEKLFSLVEQSVGIKQEFVLRDPQERNIRKALNFGHTMGHAFEALSLQRNNPLLHGVAVALGMIGELYLSVKRMGFPDNKFQEISRYILKNYPEFPIFTRDYPSLYQFMLHDKKNVNQGVNFTLLKDVGDYSIDNICTKDEIYRALDQYGKLKK